MHNYENEHILDMISDEFSWPASDRALLAWYMNRLGLNRLILLWQEQSLENEHHRPKSPYRAFRARLSRSLGQSAPRVGGLVTPKHPWCEGGSTPLLQNSQQRK